MSKSTGVGRFVIEWLKQEYRDGRVFPDTPALIAIVRQRFDLNEHTGSWNNITAWDRQARYERSDEGHAPSNPIATYSFERHAAPSPKKRRTTRRVLINDLTTRAGNVLRQVQADAGQPDATRSEIETMIQLENVNVLLSRLPTD